MSIHQLHVPAAHIAILAPPTIFFTLCGEGEDHPHSMKVLAELQTLTADDPNVTCRVLRSSSELTVEEKSRAVAIFDGFPRRASNCFSPMLTDEAKAPDWAKPCRWSMVLNRSMSLSHSRLVGCAHMTRAIFGKCFRREIDRGNFPWGVPKRGTEGPRDIVEMDTSQVEERLAALNSGPDLAAAVASREFAKDLPANSRISWLRVPITPLSFSEERMLAITKAMRALEVASGLLVRTSASVADTILAGVGIEDERLRRIYIDPGVPCFSVARPDVHWSETGVKVSENDEMPGGMPELVHIDVAYGVNEDRWKSFFDWLTAKGPLVFLVSHQWSECYIPETTWLVEHLVSKGYPVRILTTDQLDRLSITPEGVLVDGVTVGTFWRQFPIFETVGKLADLVVAAHGGVVRLVPEFAHFGNKAWFHVFARQLGWFERNMQPDDFALLREIIPDSHFVQHARSFPCHVGELYIDSVQSLKMLGQDDRDKLVLKICGANNLAARSYGVLIGEGIRSDLWQTWMNDRLNNNQPFIIQERFHTGVMRMPVWNTKHKRAEVFSCRVLMRPWAYNGTVVSVHGCAVPHQFHKVHGMVSMAVSPVTLRGGELAA